MLSPQQSTVPEPSSRRAQPYRMPMLIWLKVPGGGTVEPLSLKPQQVRVLSVRMPQLDRKPATTCLNVPGGAVDCPSPLAPQQTAVLSASKPQPWAYPALASMYVPGGGVDWPGPSLTLSPQHVTTPSARTPHVM